MSTDRVGPAVAAAVAVARSLGLTVDDPAVLSDGINVVVHLRPAPVVARVATLTRLLRPDVEQHLAREVRVAGALAAAGAAVVAPSDLLPPGPHTADGQVLSFWQHLTVLDREPAPAEVGVALGELHGALAGIGPPPGRVLDTPRDDLAAFVAGGAALGADPVLVQRVGELTERLGRMVGGPVQAVHGDAHPGNLLATPDGWRWVDLEDTCPGPLGWDLACLRTTRRLDGRAAVDATPTPMSDEELRPLVALRVLHAAAWAQAYASAHPEHLPGARARLTTAVHEVSAALGR